MYVYVCTYILVQPNLQPNLQPTEKFYRYLYIVRGFCESCPISHLV